MEDTGKYLVLLDEAIQKQIHVNCQLLVSHIIIVLKSGYEQAGAVPGKTLEIRLGLILVK